jgi:heterodisulfide reductase subunit D
LWLNLRNDLVNSGYYPEQIDIIKENLEQSRNVFNEENEERAEWVEDVENPPEDLFVRDKAEVVYFTGCTAAFYPTVQEIPMALTEILTHAHVDFTLLGEEEWCCGFPLLGAGLKEMGAQFIDHNIRAVLSKGARQVVFACPSCYRMWKEWYPCADHGIAISHSTGFLLDLIMNSRVQFKPLDLTVTYHDPCDLGRGAGEFDAPRRIIQAIPGIRFVELVRNRENCACCGGGGNLEMIDPDLAAGIAKAKIDEALSTGAQAIVTSCQQCVRTMLTYVKRNKIPIQVMDITRLVLMGLRR